MGFKINQIDKNEHLFYFKIIENQYITNFIEQGQIYMGLLKKYRVMENQEGNCEIGDQFEAAFPNSMGAFIKINEKYEEISGVNVGNNIRSDMKQCIFSSYSQGIKDFEKIDEQTIVQVFSKEELYKICKEKGGIKNCSVIVFDTKLVLKIIDEIKKKNLYFMSKPIVYDDGNYELDKEASAIEQN